MRLARTTLTVIVCLFSQFAVATAQEKGHAHVFGMIPSVGQSVNDYGEAVGSASDNTGTDHAILVRRGIVHFIPTPDGGNRRSNATFINVHADVVGDYLTSDGSNHAFLFSKGKSYDLGTLGGSNSYATGINNHGTIVGYSDTGDGQFNYHKHAFLYSNGKMTDLGTLGGGNYDESYGRAVNDHDEVVGMSVLEDGTTRAFGYVKGVFYDIGSLGGASCANAINNKGEAVGFSYLADNSAIHAFLTSGGQVTDLGILSGQSGSMATGINDHGVIVGLSGNLPFLFSSGKMRALPKSQIYGGILNGISNTGYVVGTDSVGDGFTYRY